MAGFDRSTGIEIEIAITEAVNNSIEHACDNNPDLQIEFTMEIRKDRVVFTVADRGTPCVSLPCPSSFSSENMETEKLPERCFGLHIINSVMNKVEYRTGEDANNLIMTKYRPVMDNPLKDALVLVVDDNRTNSLLLSVILKKEGCRVLCAENGLLGVEAAIEHSPDLILLDLEMPVMDGYEACRKLKSHETTQDIPVLVVSSETALSSKLSCFALGAADYVTKPFRRPEVVARVKNQIAISSLTASLRRKNMELREKQRQIELDLKAAANIQKALLPSSLPEYGGISLSYHFSPCEHVGGDIFNVQRLDEDHLGIYICDISGHGVSAAMIASLVYQAMDINAGIVKQKISSPPWYALTGPLKVLEEIDMRFPVERFEHYLTMLYIILNFKNGSFIYSSAGHPPMLQTDGHGRITAHKKGGTIIGLGDIAPEREEGKGALRDGDRLFLYSDGLFELVSPEGGMFGTERLKQAISSCSANTLDDVPGCMESIISDFSRGTPPADDITLLVMEFRPGRETGKEVNNGLQQP